MQLVGMNINTIAYIESENEFDRAKMRGFWQTVLSLARGRVTQLSSFAEAVDKLQPYQTISLGLQDIPLKNIVGTVGRERDFTCGFFPRTNNTIGKERWRKIYTLAVTGEGFPPVDVYKVGQGYFVEDGHHRVSVARHLAWDTIQANVTEVSSSAIDQNSSNGQFNLDNGVELCTQS